MSANVMDGTSAYLTSLVTKSAEEIDAEMFQLYARDKQLEQERSKLVLTNHRQLVTSILRLHTVQSQVTTGKLKLEECLDNYGALKSSLEDSKSQFEQYREAIKIARHLEQEQEALAQALSTPLRLKLALEERKWSEFQAISVQFASEISVTCNPVPEFIIDLIDKVIRLQDKALPLLINAVVSPTKSLSECATELGNLESLSIQRNLLKDRLTSRRIVSSLTSEEEQLLNRKGGLESLFTGCWKLQLERLKATFATRLDLSTCLPETMMECVSEMTDHLHNFGLHFTSLFKKPVSRDVAEIFQSANLWLISLLDRWRSQLPEIDPEAMWTNCLKKSVLTTEVSKETFTQQLCGILKPPKKLSSLSSSDSFTFVNLAQLLSKVETFIKVLSRLSANAQPLIGPKLLNLITLKITATLQALHTDFETDLDIHFDDKHPNHFSRQIADPSPMDIKDSSTTIFTYALKQLTPYPPLLFWLNGHLQLLNDCRIFSDWSFEKLILRGFFESIRSMCLTFRQFSRHGNRLHDQLVSPQLNLISEAIGEVAVPALLSAESAFFEFDKRFASESPKDQQLELLVHKRDAFVRLMLDKCLCPQSARPCPRTLRLEENKLMTPPSDPSVTTIGSPDKLT